MAVNSDEIWSDQTHWSFSHDFCSLTGNKEHWHFSVKERLQELWILSLEVDGFIHASSLAWLPLPNAQPGVISSTRWLEATHHTVVFCMLIYALLLAQRWKPFPHQSIRKVLSLFQFCYLLPGMAEWLTALGIDSVPFARREWCFFSKEATSGYAGFLNSSNSSCYAQGREVHLVVAMWVKEGFVLFGFYSLIREI